VRLPLGLCPRRDATKAAQQQQQQPHSQHHTPTSWEGEEQGDAEAGVGRGETVPSRPGGTAGHCVHCPELLHAEPQDPLPNRSEEAAHAPTHTRECMQRQAADASCGVRRRIPALLSPSEGHWPPLPRASAAAAAAGLGEADAGGAGSKFKQVQNKFEQVWAHCALALLRRVQVFPCSPVPLPLASLRRPPLVAVRCALLLSHLHSWLLRLGRTAGRRLPWVH
jgi:hypothetical protein